MDKLLIRPPDNIKDTSTELYVPYYDIIFPIKRELKEDECRDKFLTELFAELNLPEHEKEVIEEYEKYSSVVSYVQRTDGSRFSVYSIKDKYFDINLEPLEFVPGLVHILVPERTSKFLSNFSTRKTYSDRYSDKIFDPEILHQLNVPEEEIIYMNLYQTIKRSALYYNFSNMIERLNVIFDYTGKKGDIDVSDAPFNLFSWGFNDFLNRRTFDNSIYLDVLKREHEEKYLNQLKFRIDIRELIRFYKFIYLEYFHDLPNWEKTVLEMLNDASDYLNLESVLEKGYKLSKETLAILNGKIAKISYVLWGSYNVHAADVVAFREMNETIINPIEYRYQRDWYHTKANIKIMTHKAEEEKIKKEIDHYNELSLKITYCNNVVLNTYYAQIEDYNNRYKALKIKYSNDCDEVENEIVIMKFRLAKVQGDYDELVEKVEMFRQRVQEVQNIIIMEENAKNSNNLQPQPASLAKVEVLKKSESGDFSQINDIDAS